MDGNHSFSKKPTHTPIQQTDVALVALSQMGTNAEHNAMGCVAFSQYLQDNFAFKCFKVWSVLQSQAGITVSWKHQRKTKFT